MRVPFVVYLYYKDRDFKGPEGRMTITYRIIAYDEEEAMEAARIYDQPVAHCWILSKTRAKRVMGWIDQRHYLYAEEILNKVYQPEYFI